MAHKVTAVESCRQMHWRAVVFIVLIVMCWQGSPSAAAEISCNFLHTGEQDFEHMKTNWGKGKTPVPYVTCFGGLLQGTITKGDYNKVATFLRAHHPFVSNFLLASPGGDVDEALKIGRLFRTYLIATTAPDTVDIVADFNGTNDGDVHLASGSTEVCRGENCMCASACALIWLGSVYRSGIVGLHRPKIEGPMFRGLPPAEASTAYRQLLERIVGYLDEMEVPKSIGASMVGTGSGDIVWVKDDGLERPPSIAEWEDASCGTEANFSNVVAGSSAWSQLAVKSFRHADCIRNHLAINRGRLSPP